MYARTRRMSGQTNTCIELEQSQAVTVQRRTVKDRARMNKTWAGYVVQQDMVRARYSHKTGKFVTGRVRAGRGSMQDKQSPNWFRTVRVSGQYKCRSKQS